MTLADLCAALIVVGLTAYAALGGADFGAGFWDLTAGGPERGARVRGLVQRSMAPVWEANHVWLVFVLVVFWTAFPRAFGAVMSALYVPLFLAAVGIILRGTSYAVRGEATSVTAGRVLGATFALSSVLTPFFLGAAIGTVASGHVPATGGSGAPFSAWLHPTSLIAGTLAVVTGAHLAAVYMAGDAARLGLEDLRRGFRARALGAGAVAGALAIGGLAVVRADAPALYDGLTSGGGLACVLVSALAGATALGLVWTERFDLARFAAALAVAGITIGWGVAQHPAILPHLTVDQAASPRATLVALLASIGVGLLIIGPCLVALYRMALTERLGEGFRPLPSAGPGRSGGRPGPAP